MADTPIPASDVVVGKFYRAVHSDQCGPNDFPFIVSLAHDVHRRPGDPPSTPAAWGFSVYRRVAAYRTLGCDFAEWAALPGNAGMVIYEDRDRRLDKPPRSPIWASRQPSDSNKSRSPAPGGDRSGVENER